MRVPEIPSLTSVKNEKGICQLMYVVYGAQRDDHDFHRAGFTERLLGATLRSRGFCGVRRVGDFHYFASDSTKLTLAERPISLNLRATAC